MKKVFNRIMIITLTILLFLVVFVFVFLGLPMFGKTPDGARLDMIVNSPNYKNAEFHNFSMTPVMTEKLGFKKIFRELIFKKNYAPVDSIPTMKTDLLNLDPDENILVWFGHSSYFMQIDGKRILVDPVLSGAASPIPVTVKAFKGTLVYTTDDIPEIDYLFITHDHWDHLDYQTIKNLEPQINKVICGLGTGAHFGRWGFDKDRIIEKDWNEEIALDPGFTAYTVTSRHFSGRSFKRNKSLWASFVLQTPTMRIFLGCDGGYDTHFAEIGAAYNGFDLAILENGQYNNAWKYIHMFPEQVIQAATDLHAKRILPVHSCKFSLSSHTWDEPLQRISELSNGTDISVMTPLIGQQVNLKDDTQQFSNWWEGIK